MATNGRLDISTLTLVDGWAYLTKNAAAGWERGCDDLVAMGYPRPSITAPDGAYRTILRQEYWAKFWSDRGQPLNAATVGTSGHGWATDVDIFEVWRWPHDVLVEVFGKYGFTFNFSPEPWHMHHDGMAVAALNVTRITEQKEEPDMQARYLWTKDAGDKKPAYGIFGQEVPGGLRVSRSEATAEVWGAMYGTPAGAPWKELTAAQWVRLNAEAKVINADWVKQQTAIAKAAGGTTTVSAAPIDYEALAAAIAEALPKKLTGVLS